ncbi:adenylate/guanylate cyclase domain-containing protein [Sphingomonas sp. AR_OL41]|uniref:CHASE2 domain-containing protein n=1 Tax=Sphingomonas sp. AR_OL41 TaxID=3042729 RepID=UPI002480B1CE|nr:adenylate/guanylate cyclase domain-containing protein [Sphingomonas sp. AR_OL41]MDH7971214.1 adenylate/guanylate cyclase domain-containing protein [Sphingomonas sp. AR_OL41]
MGGRLRQALRKRGGAILPGLAALFVALLLQAIGVSAIDRASAPLFDSYQRAKPRAYQDAGVRVIDIDDETLRRFGQWPWPRTDLAALNTRLADAGAAAIGYDIVFSEPDRTSPAQLAGRLRREGGRDAELAVLGKLPDNDAVLADAFGKTNVVLSYFLTGDGKGGQVEPKMGFAYAGSQPRTGKATYTGAIQPLPALRAAARGLGFVSLPPDSDGIIRKAPLISTENGQLLPAFSLEALRVAYQTQSVIVKSSDASGEHGGDGANVVSLKVGDSEVPTTAEGRLLMYYTAPHPARVVPAWKVLTGQLSPAEMERDFAGQIVLVGTSAAGLYDLKSTPLADTELGVVIHAQALEQIITKTFLSQPDWATGAERAALLLLGLVMAFSLPWLGATRGAILGLVMVGGLLLGSWEAFSRARLLLDPTWPVLGLIFVYVIETGITFYREERQRAYIHNAFDRYLSPEMVRQIVDDPGRLQLGGEERQMTVLFCDIRGFSRLSEKLTPQEIIQFLIAFLTPMCDILLANKATIDKFIGDAVLAFWNAPLDDPDQYANAARSALAMTRRLREINVEKRSADDPLWPGNVSIGIGLNAGPCCVGNMGSAQRLSYSLIGDTVNLASRIEGMTKYYGLQIAIGSELRRHLPHFAIVSLDHVKVVGREAPEEIFGLLGDESLEQEPGFRDFAVRHQAMLDAYRAQDWALADRLAVEGQGAAVSCGLRKFYLLMRERAAYFAAHPPGADWDGVFSATEK